MWKYLPYIFLVLLTGCLSSSESHSKIHVWHHLKYPGLAIENMHEDPVVAGVTALTGKLGAIDLKIVERSNGVANAAKIYDDLERGVDSIFLPHEVPYSGAASPKLGCGQQK